MVRQPHHTTPQPGQAVATQATQPKQTLMPYDENLLERSRTQWQFGDWQSLIKLNRDTLQHHPDRAKLALLAAAGHLQTGKSDSTEARQFIRLAQDWGIDKKLIGRMLIAGVHNNLARAAAVAKQETRAWDHFEQTINLGSPGAAVRRLIQARVQRQLQELQLLLPQTDITAPFTKPKLKDCYLCFLKLRLNNDHAIELGFNTTTQTDNVKIHGDLLKYHGLDNKPIYLVSNEHGSFQHPPIQPQVKLKAGMHYMLSGELDYEGEHDPIIWFFQYAGGKCIDSQSIDTNNGKFTLNIQIKIATESVAIGLRIAGIGTIKLKEGQIALCYTGKFNDKSVSNYKINYKSYDDLVGDIKSGLCRLHLYNFDLVVGIPRSGMLVANIIAGLLNIDVTSFDGLINNSVLIKGYTRKLRKNIANIDNAKNILIVDDSIHSGETFEKIISSMPQDLRSRSKFIAVYSSSRKQDKVDFYFKYIAQPRAFEWNIFHSSYMNKACVDIDDVLCKGPTIEQNDDDKKYVEFILNAEPYILPSYRVHSLVTNRLEKYRKHTKYWLKKHGINYDNLIMLDFPNKKERIRTQAYISHKVNYYKKNKELILFVESSEIIAKEILEETNKPVLCTDINKMLNP